MRIAVAGGTGWIGRLVVAAASGAGHEVAVVARSTGVDLTTGAGLDEALRGVDAVIDVVNRNTLREAEAVDFFTTTSRRLLDAGQRAGVGHHVLLSIVGIDRVGLGYYIGKLRQEEVVRDGPVPSTILRATQFFEFASQMLERSVGPVVAVPRMTSQPVAAREVAAELVRLAPHRQVSLDQALEFIRYDEAVAVTPRSIRLRKVELSASKRQSQASRRKRERQAASA